MNECVDGEYQSFKAQGRRITSARNFSDAIPRPLKLVEDMTDEEIGRLRRGGHDPLKVYNAYKAAMEHKGGPTLILAKTVKGYGMGEIEARNPTHQQKKLNDKTVQYSASGSRFRFPKTRRTNVAFYRPPEASPEMAYMHERRRQLGGYMPQRSRAGEPDYRLRRSRSLTNSCMARRSRILRPRWLLCAC